MLRGAQPRRIQLTWVSKNPAIGPTGIHGPNIEDPGLEDTLQSQERSRPCYVLGWHLEFAFHQADAPGQARLPAMLFHRTTARDPSAYRVIRLCSAQADEESSGVFPLEHVVDHSNKFRDVSQLAQEHVQE